MSTLILTGSSLVGTVEEGTILIPWQFGLGLRLPGVKVVGLILVHPFFGGTEDDRMWLYMCPTNGGLEDPRLKPAAKDLSRLGCERVLIFIAQTNHLSGGGKLYYEELKNSGWVGNVEVVEHEGEAHVFHLKKLARV
jgi:hypothetical protein